MKKNRPEFEDICRELSEQLHHRLWIKKVETFSKNLLSVLGFIFAMVITVPCFAAGVLFLLFGQNTTSTVFFGLTLLGLVSRFVNGARKVS